MKAIPDWMDIPAVKLAGLIRRRELSSVEVVDAFLQRIDEVNPAINAVVQVVAERARTEARAADDAIAHGRDVGPFHGVPFTAKDNLDTEGVVTSTGLPERRGHVPTRDATVIARMRAAGAILIGKTNCPPGGGGGNAENDVYGRTCNPYDQEHSPGGSSSGEAAIQAAGGAPFGIGSDSGGSIRLPAHYCGVAALKPTSGRVPSTGALYLPGGLTDPRSQIGPMSRFVADLGPVLSVIMGIDWHDSGTIPMPFLDPNSVSLSHLKIAFYADDTLQTPTPETAQVIDEAARQLVGAGADVTSTRPEFIGSALEITRRYWKMSDLDGDGVDALLTDWDEFRSRMLGFMRQFDAILCPVSSSPAVLHGQVSDLSFSYTLPFSLAGYPCVVVRAGTSRDGLPIGVQIVARPWREDVAIAIAAEIERRLGGWQPPAWGAVARGVPIGKVASRD